MITSSIPTTLPYIVPFVLEPMPTSAPQSNNPNVNIQAPLPSIYDILTPTLILSSLLSQLTQPRNHPLDLKPYLPTHSDAPIVESNFDSDTNYDVEHITLPNKTPQP